MSILIFLVILVNEFPDLPADAQVNKRTLIVWLGVPTCVWIYRATLTGSFVLAALMLTQDRMFFAGLFYLFTLPLAVFAMKLVNAKELTRPGYYHASQHTVLLHTIGTLFLATGFVVWRLV